MRGKERSADRLGFRPKYDHPLVQGQAVHEVHDPREKRPPAQGEKELRPTHARPRARSKHDPGHRSRSAARSTASATWAYPVHRQRFPARYSRISSRVGRGFSWRRA